MSSYAVALSLGNYWNYLRRILKVLSLLKKIEYTVRIAPAQLGKAKVKVKGYIKTGSDRLRVFFGMRTIFKHLTALTISEY